MNYSPVSNVFVLMSEDGSYDTVPAGEISDHVPLVHYVLAANCGPKKRRASSRHEPATKANATFSEAMQTATEDSKHPEPASKRPLTPPVKQCKQPVTESEERKQPALALKRLQPPPAKRCKSPEPKVKAPSKPARKLSIIDLTSDEVSDDDEEKAEEEKEEQEEETKGLIILEKSRVASVRVHRVLPAIHIPIFALPASSSVAMNYGIINNSRPDPRKRGGAGSVNALLADPRMREIAKQMGLQPKDFGEEAQTLWQTLNDLSTSDPKRYEAFINEQLQDGPPLPPSAESSSNQTSHDTAAAAPRFFTPDPGFVVKCTMYHSFKCQQKETKLFLNICAHNLIDAPKNPNSGLEVPEDTRAVPNTNSLQVPLVVGKLREITDFSGALCCVVDVVVNPWVLRRCEWDSSFKREVMKLAVQWVQQDAGVRLVAPTGKFIKARYKGGVAVGNEIITSKFRIKDADPAKQRMESPADLLKQIHLDEADKDEATRELTITPSKEIRNVPTSEVLVKAPSLESVQPPPAPTTTTENKPQKKKVLIEELSPTSSKQGKSRGTSKADEPASSARSAPQKITQRQKKNGGAVKRGFLNSSKAQLYPTGSSEGRPSSSYVNLLSRSKIVDLGEVERQRKAQEEARKETMAFLQPKEKAKTTQRSAAATAEAEEIDHGDHIFDQLCQLAEPDLKPSTQGDGLNSRSSDTPTSDQIFGEGFEEFTKLLTT
ncbi:unnamed protein product [Phytophthora lilii]|uniref:Unnamed protein product n=1 Tax=Phytophthora lilii TaxID=2077276 RepID=A0A9W6WU88_9STRA|nr:unnamed protein product [Phytophthora lilii]